MKPIIKTDIEKVDELLKIRTEEIAQKLDELSTKVSTKHKEENVRNIIEKMKDKIPEKIVRPETRKKDIEEEIPKKDIVEVVKGVVKEVSHDDDVFCPTCNKGHVHKLDNLGLTLKCTDKSCNEKFFVIPESSNYACENCGFPLKEPSVDKEIDACPFCKHDGRALKFIDNKPPLKFDFSKIRR